MRAGPFGGKRQNGNHPTRRRPLGLAAGLVLFFGLLQPAWADTVNHVVFVSFDGLRGDLLEDLIENAPGTYPNFKRFVDEGATTFNARSDYDVTETLPNHTTMATGRGVDGSAGYNWIWNGDPSPSETIESNKHSYVASVWDVVHDNGLSTSLYATKSKLVLFDQSYNAATGAPDTTGPNNGRDKIDRYVYSSTGAVMSNFLATLDAETFNYSFVHIRDTDSAGHSGGGWGSAGWNAAAADEDGYLEDIFDVVETNATLRDRTAIIVTADHGGYSTGHPSYRIESHIVPFLVWGPGVAAGADLYDLNPFSRQDPFGGKIS